LRDYEIGSDAVARVLAQLEAHGMTRLGEREDVDLAMSRQILEACV
jgi:NADP-dependent alcohol dehydrogenase